MAKTNTEIIQVLINGDYDTLTKEEQQQLKTEQFLKDFIQYLKNEEHPLKESELGAVNPESFFKYINRLIDLDTNAAGTSDGTNDYLNNTGTGLWNESVNKLIDIYKNKIVNNNGTWTVNGVEFNADDILKGNAGKSFENTPWVHKNLNVDNQTYDDVRGTDKIISVLNNRIKMQFTHSQDNDNPLSKYIRLLMPQYTRRVEVEDLNRNFWVIGQTITALSAYLFDDDSPIKEMLKYLTSETTQLWENLIYLWTQVLFEKKEIPITDVRCEVVYLPNDIWNHEFKFDGYDVGTIDTNTITNRLGYLVDQYPNKNLCIIPIVRKDNYFKNYYSQELYPGIWCYDRNNKNWIIKKFNGDAGVTITKQDGDKLFFIREENGYYKWSGPNYYFSKKQDEKYVQIIRSYIKTFTCVYENDNFNPTVEIKVYDAGDYIINKPNIETISKVQISYQNNSGTYTRQNIDSSSRPNAGNSHLSHPSTSLKGVYLCEVVTKMGIPNYEEGGDIPGGDTEGKIDFKVVNIGSFVPENILTDNPGKSFTMITSSTASDRFNIETYGYGCYVIQTSSFNSYSSTKLTFMKNYNMNVNQQQTKIPRGDVNKDALKTWGSEYIRRLLNTGIISDNTIYMTRINVGYWTGSSGTVWSNGIFCDLFAVINGVISHVCPVYILDGYWTMKVTTFSVYNSSMWRQLKMKSTQAKWIKKSDSQKIDYILNGTLTWNDHNLDIQGQSQGERPHCSFYLNTRTSPNLIFDPDTYTWPDSLKDHSPVSNSQMVMQLNASKIWNDDNVDLDKDYYIFNSSYKKLDTTDGYKLTGQNDYASFSFK